MTWHRRPKDDAWRRVTLASINALGQRLWMHCNGCGHSVVEPPLAFAERARLETDTPLLIVAEALVCTRCQARKAHAWPEPYGTKLRR